MKKTKANEGITLVSLIITIVLMSILIGVTIYSGMESYDNAKATKFVTQLQLIQAKVDEVAKDAKVVTELTRNKQENNTSILDKAYQNHEIPFDNTIEYNIEYKNQFKLFTISDLENELDLENMDSDVLINFNTREVVSINGLEYDNNTFYTQYKLPQGEELKKYTGFQRQEIDFELTKEMDGLNCFINITNLSPDCTLSYGEGTSILDEIEWNTISNSTKIGETYSINISKSASYLFKLQDNENKVEPEVKTIIVLTTNKPKTDIDLETPYDYSSNIDDWAILEKTENEDIIEYVWIPRFVYRENLQEEYEIKFIKGNSNIATDNTYITIGSNEDDWSIPDIFTKDGKQLTGIWLIKSEISDFNDIIEDENITDGLEKIEEE